MRTSRAQAKVMTRIQQERTIGIPYRNKERAQELGTIHVSVKIEMYSRMHLRARRKYIYLAEPARAKFNELVGKSHYSCR